MNPSLFVSIPALVISVYIAKKQRDFQKRQLKKDLFDDRFNIYKAAREFLNYVARFDGRIELSGPEYHAFWEAVERAEMLFGSDVHKYLLEIRDTAGDLYAYSYEEPKAVETGDVELIHKGAELKKRLYVTLLQRRNDVFRPYLNLESTN